MTEQFVSAKLETESSLRKPIYVNTASKGPAIQSVVKPISSTNYSKASPIVNPNKSTVEFVINTNQGQLQTQQSYVYYTMKFAFKMAIASGVMTYPGRYFLQNKDGKGPSWWYEPYIFDTNKYIPVGGIVSIPAAASLTAVTPTEASSSAIKAQCLGPMNSLCIFEKSEVTQNGKTVSIDDYLFRNFTRMQKIISPQYQNTHSQTFFNGGEEILSFEILPFEYTGASKAYVDNTLAAWAPATNATSSASKGECEYISTTQVNYYFYHTFTCPLNIINQVFDSADMMALSQIDQTVNLKLTYQNNCTLAKTFGTSTLFDATKTGVCDIGMNLVLKDQKPSSEINEGKLIANQYKRYSYTVIPTVTWGSTTNYKHEEKYESVCDFIIGMGLNDQNEDDSTYYKQRMTPFSAAQIIGMQNHTYDSNPQFNFMSDFKLYFGNMQNGVFDTPLNDITMIKQEMLRGLNNTGDFSGNGVNNFNSIMNILTQFACIDISLEQYATQLGVDVVGDGVNSNKEQPQIQFVVKTYNNGQDAVNYNSAAQSAKTLLSSSHTPLFEVYLVYDALFEYKNKSISVEVGILEKFKQFLNKMSSK